MPNPTLPVTEVSALKAPAGLAAIEMRSPIQFVSAPLLATFKSYLGIPGEGGGPILIADLSDATAFGQSLLALADAAAARSTLGAAPTSHTHAIADVTSLQAALDARQPLATNLTTWAGITPASGVETFLATPTAANLAALVTTTGSGSFVLASGAMVDSPTISGLMTVGSGAAVALGAGSTVTLNGAFAGTPTGGTLNLANLTLTLPTALNTPVIYGSAQSLTSPQKAQAATNIGVGTTDSPSLAAATLTAAPVQNAALAATRALTGDLFPHWFLDRQICQAYWGQDGGTDLVGSGSVTGEIGGKSLQTGATANSSAVIFASPSYDITSSSAGNGQKIDWSKTVFFSFPVMVANTLTTNGIVRVQFGSTNGAASALNARGVGIKLTYASANVANVALEVHDGSTLTVSGTLTTVDTTAFTNHRYTIVSAAGTAYLFVDGVYAGSSTGGPSTVGGSGLYHKVMILNGTDATNQSIAVSGFRAYAKP